MGKVLYATGDFERARMMSEDDVIQFLDKWRPAADGNSSPEHLLTNEARYLNLASPKGVRAEMPAPKPHFSASKLLQFPASGERILLPP